MQYNTCNYYVRHTEFMKKLDKHKHGLIIFSHKSQWFSWRLQGYNVSHDEFTCRHLNLTLGTFSQFVNAFWFSRCKPMRDLWLTKKTESWYDPIRPKCKPVVSNLHQSVVLCFQTKITKLLTLWSDKYISDILLNLFLLGSFVAWHLSHNHQIHCR